MSTVTLNGAEAVKPSAANVAGAARQQVNTSSSSSSSNGGKVLDSTRLQAASPIDPHKGKTQPPQPKAWQGPNPITQRASTQTPNGTEKPLPKLPTQPHIQNKSIGESQADKHAYDRAIFLFANLTGHEATLTLKNGEQFTGVFSGGNFESTSKCQYILKMVKRVRSPSPQQVNGDVDPPTEFVGEGDDHVMMFDKDDTVDLATHDVLLVNAPVMQNGTAAPIFRTDAEISGRDPLMPRERELQRWDAGPESSVDMSLESSGEAGWDQFAANKQMYGVESTYDENIYTTAIDRSNPGYKAREATAARIAREIEGSAPVNAHVAEERQLDADRSNAVDEEEKYSGVQREAVILPKRSAGAYVPPSQRPLTNTPTVSGAPFDPAIISSSLAKPAPPADTGKADDAVPAPTPATAPAATSGEQAVTAGEQAATAGQQAAMTGEQVLATPQNATTSQTPATQAPPAPKKCTEPTAEEHVRNAADAFKAFANDQKLRAKMSVEQRRSTARTEKNVKLNDLKLFSQRFQIKSRVPDDLVPILAKDPQKQNEIRHRAEQAAQLEEVKVKERETQKQNSIASPTPSASSAVGTIPTAPAVPAAPALAPEQRLSFSQQQNARARVTQNLRGVAAQSSPGKTLGATASNRNHPRANLLQGQPGDARIPSGPAGSAVDGPLSPKAAIKLNVRASEFRPTADSFTPSGQSPSRTTRSSMDRSNVSESIKAPAFFEKDKKPTGTGERKSANDAGMPLQHLLDAEYPEEHKKVNAANGGLPKPYQAPPTWQYVEANVNVTYKDSFAKSQVPSTGPSPMHTPNPNGHMPHAHQLPPHLQGGPMPGPAQRLPYMPTPGQQAGGPHQVFDPRMQQFGPNGGSVQSSPRFPQAQMAFNGQMPGMQMQGMGMPQFAGQQMHTGYGMSPNMAYRQMNMAPAGPMMMMPPSGGQHGPMVPMPQGFPPRGPGGPQYQPNQMMASGVPMMQQHSSGGFINNGPPMMPQHNHGQSYSPMPPHAQPHMNHMQNHQGGYGGSPRPHPMQHSGSHQGFQQPGGMMQGAPFGGGGGGPGYNPLYMQQRQMSSGSYVPHMTPRQQYAVPNNHASPGMGGVNHGGNGVGQGDEGK